MEVPWQDQTTQAGLLQGAGNGVDSAPAAAPGVDAAHRLLFDAVEQWRSLIERPAGTAAELGANMDALYRAIYGTDFTALDPVEVKSIAPRATDELFDLYLTLRDRVPEWRERRLMEAGAPLAVRNAMRILRYTIDIIGEVASDYVRLGAGEHTHPGFGGPLSWTMIHPSRRDGERVEFRSGDVLLMRGQLNNSAAIARIGDAASQFSHVGIVHIDGNGERWVVEALIEEGSTRNPMDDCLGHGLSRVILFRHRDTEMACRAADLVARLVDASRSSMFGWIPYDFSMELAPNDRFFCSKLVRHAYLAASHGRLSLPSFPTRLSMTNRDFFDRIGVTAHDTFAPGDMEVEPGFDLVAEWRDYRVTSNVRMQDLLMSKLFDWMDEYGYEFRAGLGMSVAALAGRFTSWCPDLLKNALCRLGLPKIPSNMGVRTIATIGMLHQTAQPILERLIALEAERIATTGRPLHPREVQEELERFRASSGGRIGYLVAPER